MNKAILIGNVATDPELRRTSGDIPVCTFRLAVQRRFSNQQGVREADFFNIVAWRERAELCAKYLTKGRKCGVVGIIQNRSYDAQDGTKRYITEIVIDEIEFFGSQQGQPNQADNPPPPAAPPAPYSGGSGFTHIENDDELPF